MNGMADSPDDCTIQFVSEVWRLALGRQPEPADLRRMALDVKTSGDPIAFLLATAACKEATDRRAAVEAVRLFVPPGHFYSPVVGPSELEHAYQPSSEDTPGITLDLRAMEAVFHHLMDARGELRFPSERTDGFRYYYQNEMFDYGDAAVLSGMLRYLRPQRWIEVGCGYSSAALLDTLDRTPSLETWVTFIEPNPGHRLNALLLGADQDKARIIEAGVQQVHLDLFEELEANDVLFLDTTHISKTGSDVNHELFEILPRLNPGVVIHFHDVFDGFEYPPEWVFQQNRSWNEQYLLRAFLTFNPKFEIFYANDAFARRRPEVVKSLDGSILANPGGGLWLRRK
jgi:predicted O-methyltransferase YrrM